MANDTKIFESIKQILVERFAIPAANVQPPADLQKELNLDSMDAIDLLMAVNETFHTRVPDQTLEHIHTIAELVAVVEKYKPK